MKARDQLNIINNLLSKGMDINDPNLIPTVNKVSKVIDQGEKVSKKMNGSSKVLSERDLENLKMLRKAQPVLVDAFSERNPDVPVPQILLGATQNIALGEGNVGGRLDEIQKGLTEAFGDRSLQYEDIEKSLLDAGWSEDDVNRWKTAKYEDEVRRRRVASEIKQEEGRDINVSTQGELDPNDPALHQFGWRSLVLPEAHESSKGEVPYSMIDEMFQESEYFDPAPEDRKDDYRRGLVIEFLKNNRIKDDRIRSILQVPDNQ